MELVTGERVLIESPGEQNSHQGPDFINARIRISGNYWVGSVELHLFSSGWFKHCHSADGNYSNVILHVVWKQDRPDTLQSIPEIELCNRIPRLMLDTYSGWMFRSAFIPCEQSASKSGSALWENWASSLLIKRMNRKMSCIMDSLRTNQYHWEEQLWWMTAAHFGSSVNAAAFESIARSIPFSLLAKHRHQFIQLEALFMGQANLLDASFSDPYPAMLKKEFTFLKKKYGLKKVYETVHFMRMRPEGFPYIRLSQMATFFAETTSFFSWLLVCESILLLKNKLIVRANDYWQNHYVFEKTSPFREKILGTEMCHHIIINAIIPLLYTYGKIIPDQVVLKKSITWLEQIPVEQNQLVKNWKRIGITVKKATGSQALTELKKQYCDRRKCLECEIGKHLLQPATIPGCS